MSVSVLHKFSLTLKTFEKQKVWLTKKKNGIDHCTSFSNLIEIQKTSHLGRGWGRDCWYLYLYELHVKNRTLVFWLYLKVDDCIAGPFFVYGSNFQFLSLNKSNTSNMCSKILMKICRYLYEPPNTLCMWDYEQGKYKVEVVIPPHPFHRHNKISRHSKK